ncbi:MAG TPA: hypothetical protein VM409_02890 [Chloroflexia bacterium]|nr:hypothetical protein [Chloroflexia bacterium]
MPDDLNGSLPSSRRPARSVVEPVPVLDSAEAVQVQVEILRESYDRILDVLRANELDNDEGMRTVLLSGLGYMDASLYLGRVNRGIDGGDGAAAHVESLVQDLASYHTMYSVLKYKTFKLYKLSQKLEMNVAGLRAAEEMWAEWAERMRRERADMQAEIIKLRALLTEFNLDVELPPTSVRNYMAPEPQDQKPPPEPPRPIQKLPEVTWPDEVPSLWTRLRKLLGGK